MRTDNACSGIGTSEDDDVKSTDRPTDGQTGVDDEVHRQHRAGGNQGTREEGRDTASNWGGMRYDERHRSQNGRSSPREREEGMARHTVVWRANSQFAHWT